MIMSNWDNTNIWKKQKWYGIIFASSLKYYRSLMTNFGAKVLLCKILHWDLMFCYCWFWSPCVHFLFPCLVGSDFFRFCHGQREVLPNEAKRGFCALRLLIYIVLMLQFNSSYNKLDSKRIEILAQSHFDFWSLNHLIIWQLKVSIFQLNSCSKTLIKKRINRFWTSLERSKLKVTFYSLTVFKIKKFFNYKIR